MDTTDVNVVHYDLADVARMTGSAGKRFRLETLDFVGKESSVFADTEKMRVKTTWRVSEPFTGIHMKMNLHARDSSPVGITHPVDLGAAEPGKVYTSVFEFAPSLLGEGQYFFYLDIFDGALAHAVCLDKPVTEFAFEVTNSDLTMPEWASGWAHPLPAGQAGAGVSHETGFVHLPHGLSGLGRSAAGRARCAGKPHTMVLSASVPDTAALAARLDATGVVKTVLVDETRWPGTVTGLFAHRRAAPAPLRSCAAGN